MARNKGVEQCLELNAEQNGIIAARNFSVLRRVITSIRASSINLQKSRSRRRSVYAYRDRKVRKREFRRLWIVRIGAAARQNGLNYNQFISGLKKAGVDMDRKILADIALQDPAAFTSLAETAKGAPETGE